METTEVKPLDALAVYVRRVMKENNLTVYAVEKQARKRGGTMGKSTVDAILQGRLNNPGIFTLQELAWGLSRPVDELLGVALGIPVAEGVGFKKSDFANLYDMYTQMKKPDQRFFDRTLEMMDREARRLLSGE